MSQELLNRLDDLQVRLNTWVSNMAPAMDVELANTFRQICIGLFNDIVSETEINTWPMNYGLYRYITAFIDAQATLCGVPVANKYIFPALTNQNFNDFSCWLNTTFDQYFKIPESLRLTHISRENVEELAQNITTAIQDGEI